MPSAQPPPAISTHTRLGHHQIRSANAGGEEGGGGMNDEGAGRGSGVDEPTGGGATERVVGGGRGVGWGMTTGGGQKSGEGEEGGATALRIQRPEWAACVDPGARTAWREVAVWR